MAPTTTAVAAEALMAAALMAAALMAAALMAAALAISVIGPRTASAADRVDEYKVKAAMLFNLGKFVTWPHDALGGEDEPLRICIIGNDPFGPSIDSLNGRSLKNHPVRVERHVKPPVKPCQIVFLAVPRDLEVATLRSLGDNATLVVGDTDGFAMRGGMVNMAVVDAKVRFRVNLEATRSAGIGISARLLRLATVVKR